LDTKNTSTETNNKPEKRETLFGIFNDSFPPMMDGVAVCVENTAYWLHRKGEQVCVVTPTVPDYPYTTPYPLLSYVSLPLILRRPYRIGIPEVDFSIRTKLDATPFSLVHAHCPFSSGKLALRVKEKQKVPMIATFHSKYKDDFKRAVLNKHIVELMVKEVVKFYEAADEVWIPQASVEETIREYGYKGKLTVVENGTDFSADGFDASMKLKAREEIGASPGDMVFLFVGQHIWEKNIRLIVESLDIVRHLPYKMFFVGTGYAAEELKRFVGELHLSDKIIFTGPVYDREKLKTYYAASDLFLFPSLYDNAPLVVREASAMHTPSVLVKDSTAAEIIQNNSNGFLIKNSAQDLAHLIAELYSDPARLQLAGENASLTIARSWENIAGEISDRYHSLIQRKWKQ